MRIQSSLLGLLTLLEFFLITSFAVPDEDVYRLLADPSVIFTYNRLSEIENHCSSFLSSSSELKPGVDRKDSLMAELSFGNGDWEQITGGLPLMPYVDVVMPSTSTSSLPTPLKLVSFEVKDVSPVNHFRNAVSLGGLLVIGISSESSFAHGFNPAPNFIRPGSSGLTFAFEGIYTETEENRGGERRLCLMGKSTETSGIIFGVNSDAAKGFGLENDRISLVLRYPGTFSLTKRAIHGVLKSLNEKASPKYFDTVYISSQSNHLSSYHFASKVLASTSCEPYHDGLLQDGSQKYNPSDICSELDYVSWQDLSLRPNCYKSNGSYCLEDSELGSILFGKQINDVGLRFTHANLIVKIVKCSPEIVNDAGGAKVSAVLRAIPADMDPNVARTLTGLSGLILNAEGSWNPERRQLCMIGCPEGGDSGTQGCTSWISLYFPSALSFLERSTVYGSISSIRNESSNYRLLVDSGARRSYVKDRYDQQVTCDFSYNYSKFSSVDSFKGRTQPQNILSVIKHSVFRYPAPKGEEPLAQLEKRLSNELLIDGYASPDQLPDDCNERISIQMEVLSLGSLVGLFDKDGSENLTFSTGANISFTHRQLLDASSQFLNVSTRLSFKERYEVTHEVTRLSFKERYEVTQEFISTCYRNISQLCLEGLYDSGTGKMHLVGCRTVVRGTNGSEGRIDCSLDVKVQYLPANMQWLWYPTTKITITSRRSPDDPLYFGSVRLQLHSNRDSTVDYRRTTDGIIQILLLSWVMALTLIQFHYMKEQPLVVPYISLFMLALQILCFSLALLIGNENAIKPNESEFYMDSFHNIGIGSYWLLLVVLDNAGRLLLLVSLLFTTRIFLMVYQSRKQPLCPAKTSHIHNKLALLGTLAIHSLGFFTRLEFFTRQSVPVNPGSYGTDAFPMRFSAVSVIDEFGRVVQDFFLLPQILSNLWWKTNVKSLRKSYYIGFTLVRVGLHLYNYTRDPILAFQFQESESVSPNDISAKFSKFSVVTMIILAATVHIQQNWMFQKRRNSLESGNFKEVTDEESGDNSYYRYI